MKAKDVRDKLNELFPENLKASYDNVGLQVGNLLKDVKRILLALDLTREVMEEAKKLNADMIITHHPLIFNPIYKIDVTEDIGSIIKDLLLNDIVLYSSHTNFDSARMNEFLLSLLGMEECEKLSLTENIGSLAYVDPISLKDLALKCKKTFSLKRIEFLGNPSKIITKVAIVVGSGSSFIKDAVSKNVDVFLTGDISYSRALEAKRMNLSLINIPHFVEKEFAVSLKEDLTNFSEELDVFIYTGDMNPFLEV